MNPRQLLRRLSAGRFANVSFSDFVGLARAVGFEERRISGSHHIFIHVEHGEMLNIQDVRGEAKPYQLRQFLRLVERLNLRLERS